MTFGGRIAVAMLSFVSAYSIPAYDPPSSDPQRLHVFRGYVYFSADDGLHGRELWRSTSTGEVELVADITPGSEGVQIERFADFGDVLLLAVERGNGGKELWKTDGTAEGTRHIHTFNPDSGEHFDSVFGIAADGRAYIRVEGQDTSRLWVTDGTSEGTTPCDIALKDGSRISINYSGVFHKDALYVSGEIAPNKAGLFRYDTTAGSTSLVAPLDSPETDFIVLGDDQILFRGAQSGRGIELMSTDGTSEGTRLVADIAPGAAPSFPNEFAIIGGAFFPQSAPPRGYELTPNQNVRRLAIFSADDGVHGVEPWITDGTTEGTRLVTDIFPGIEGSGAYNYKVYGDRITFQARGKDTGRELWFTIRPFNTAAMLGDIYPGPKGSDPYSVHPLHENKTVFSALHPTYGEELFFASASSPQARLQKDIYPGPASSYPYWSVSLDDRVIFAATDPVHGRELWYMDTENQVGLLADIYTDGSVNPSSSPQQLTPVGDLLYFVCNDIAHGAELWASDGSNSGTRLLKDIFPGPASSNPQEITPAGGNSIFFTAEDGDSTIGLWRSEGTTESTLPIDLSAQMPRFLVTMGDTLYFSATRVGQGRELWSVGPGQVPALVCDIAPGPASSNPRNLAVLNGALYFIADDGARGEELWRSDGTEAGTMMVRDIADVPFESIKYQALVPAGVRLFMVAGSSSQGMELWRFREGDSKPSLVRDIARWDNDGRRAAE